MNPKLTPKDRNLIKGAIRRAFARSELHKQILNTAVVQHSDPSRPRVKTWAKCPVCQKIDAKSYFVVDHIEPIIPLNKSFEQMSLDEVVDRTWCDINNLTPICDECHDAKTKIENKVRKEHRDSLKPPKPPKVKRERKRKLTSK